MTRNSSNGSKGNKSRFRKSIKKTKKTSKAKLIKIDSLPEIIQNRKSMEEHRKFNWQLYAELASQRNKIQEELRSALLSKSIPYSATGFQRAVKYKYGLHPLSTLGSIIDIGGRFNIGQQVNQEFISFSALYLAQDKDTALQEHLGQEINTRPGLTPREIALTNPRSEVIVSVSVSLDKAFDLTNLPNLTPFVNLIKNFKLSNELMGFAKKLQIPQMLITTNNLLRASLLEHDWRRSSRLFDLPSNSQVFGHLLYLAGIEGIIYNSKLTGKKCIAIFPKNFMNTNSFIAIEDDPPHPDVPLRIDESNWRLTEMNFDDVLKLKK
jgi:hypothetical protein